MKKKEWIYVGIFIAILIGVFFHKVIFQRQIPFPGDLLVANAPYKTEGYLGYNPGAYPNKAQGPDVIYEIYPWRYFSIAQLKKGIIPLWNPHNFSGNPQLQDFQTAIFYPLNILYFIFPFNIAWTIIILSQPVLAMLFMYLFLREIKLSPISSIVGAHAFAFSSYMVVWIEYGNIGSTILWLPLILFLITRFVMTEQVRWFFLLVLSLFCSFIAGYIQGIFYIYLIAIFYFVYMLFKNKKKVTFHLGLTSLLIFVVPIILSSFQLLGTLALFQSSTRGEYSLEKITHLLQPVYYWVTAFVPDFFGNPATRNYWLKTTYIENIMYPGIIVLFFALYAIEKGTYILKNFFLSIALIVLIIASNIPLVKYFYLIPIPVISTTIPTRAFSIFIFSTIVLAAMGIDHWIKTKDLKSKTSFLFIGVYVGIWIFVFFGAKFIPLFYQNASIVKHNLLLPTILAVGTICMFYLKKHFKIVSVIGIFILLGIDTFYFFNKFTPFSPDALVYPSTPVVSYLQKIAGINRFWGYGSAYIPANFQSVDGTYSPEGNDPLHIKNYGVLLASSKDGKYPNVLPRPDANVYPGFGTSDLRTNSYRQIMLNLLGVKYILHLHDDSQPDTATFDPRIYQMVWRQGEWQVYQNNQALPRFFLTTEYVITKNAKDTLEQMYKIDIAKKIILEKNPSEAIAKSAKGKVSLISYEPNKVSFVTDTTGPMLLFLSDNFYPDWAPKVDNQHVSLYKADYTFRAVVVPAGKHTVTFFYNLQTFVTGVKIALIGLLILLGYSYYLTRYVKKI